MKRWLLYFLSVVGLAIFFSILLWFVSPQDSKNKELTSPLPSFLSRSDNKQVTLLDLWMPIIDVFAGSSSPQEPTLTAKSVLMYDMVHGRALYEKNSRVKMPMASLTKIMTAIVALENPKPTNRYRVPASAIVGENSMGLSEGEVLTLEELLYGLILPSGNDAAETLAASFPSYGGLPAGRQAFIQAMNDKALALGLTDTHFTNPSGLQGDGEQYTTAYDLLVMTRYALENYPQFRKTVATYSYELGATEDHYAYALFNETNLLTTYPGVKGVKTGYTPEAGLCLVTYLEYKDQKIIGILLNSENRRDEMKQLLDYSLATLGIPQPTHD